MWLSVEVTLLTPMIPWVLSLSLQNNNDNKNGLEILKRYKANCSGSDSVISFCLYSDKVHKNVFDSKSIKSNVKLHCFQNCYSKLFTKNNTDF